MKTLDEDLVDEKRDIYGRKMGIRWAGCNSVSEEFFINMLNSGRLKDLKVVLNNNKFEYLGDTHTFEYKGVTFLTVTKLPITEL
jgi:hypothetical protein